MHFFLILDFSGLTYYGRIPNTPFPDPRIESFELDETDFDLLYEDFVEPIDFLLHVLLDDGDVDFFGPARCAVLKEWLEWNLLYAELAPRQRILYEKLHEFACRAVKLGTGIVIEF